MRRLISFLLTYYRQLFIAFVVFFMVLPLGYMIGLKETTRLAGKDVVTNLPSLQQSSFLNKKFQSEFEKWWNSHFFMRRIALKLKNQLYDFANFSRIHSGYKGNVIQGKDNYLFEKVYFSSLSSKCKLVAPEYMDKIKRLHQVLKKKNIELYVILAPNKVLTYQEKLPLRYAYFFNNNCHTYDNIEKQLRQIGVPVYNAQKLMEKIRKYERYEPFSKTGTHWNFYGAGRTVQESLKAFGLADIKVKKIDISLTPYTTERDIANLLNLIIPYQTDEKFPYIYFDQKSCFQGKTAVIGNSFSNEYKKVLADVIGNEDIFHKENAPLSQREAKEIFKSKRIFFVYTDDPFFFFQGQLWKKIEMLLDNVGDNLIFSDKNLPIKQKGLSHVEKWGRWSDGRKVILKFKLDVFTDKKKLLFHVKPYLNAKHSHLSVLIKNKGHVLDTWVFQYGKGLPDTSLWVTEDMIDQDGNLQLEFDIHDPMSPYELGISSDKRKLGLGFVSLIIK